MTHSSIDTSRQARVRQREVSLSRRRFLKGAGAAIALPMFPSLLPRQGSSLAHASTILSNAPATTATGAPLRTAFLYFPNGAIQADWWPTGSGKDFQLNKTMQALTDLKEQIQVLGGLDCLEATAGPDGAGDHARASGSYLTGVRAKKTSTDIRAGISIDQAIAHRVGHVTPFRSLELSCDPVRTTGNCDSGYSCAYSYNMAWRTPDTPVTPEPNPRMLFERMFGSGSPGERQANTLRRMAQRKSILDFVLEDAKSVNHGLSHRDRIKLDDYLTGLRDIERRIEQAEKFEQAQANPEMEAPAGIPNDFPEYMRLMSDMLVLAFQTDQTRIATFMMGYEGSNRPMPFLGISEGHHHLTHHNHDEEKVKKVQQIDQWYVEQFAYLLQRLNQVEDVDGNSLLFNSMISYGSGIADGNRHNHDNLPIILAGAGGGTLNPGQYVKHSSTPLPNMFLSLADRMGCHDLVAHGDSSGRLTGI